MGVHNGHAYLELMRCLFNDLQCNFPEVSTHLERDFSTLQQRFLAEGLSFFTKTLPRFGKAIDRVLSKTLFCSANKVSLETVDFHKVHGSARPAFLRGLLFPVFDRFGCLRKDAPSKNIAAIRQVCTVLYKLEMPYEEQSLELKIRSFIETDASLPSDSFDLDDRSQRVLARSRASIKAALFGFNPMKGLPKHGPGAVASGEKKWQKMDFKIFYRELDQVYKYTDWFFLSQAHLADDLENFLNLEERDTGVSRVAFVPKDSRGPRMIAMEPTEYMWIQQSIKGLLYDWVENHTLTKGFVNFTNQNINRDLALSASQSARICTLDMKDASDRVSLLLVKELFKDTSLLSALLATRTPDVQLPDFWNGDKIHHYKKFAPMGSALCFPVEALCFWALAVGAISEWFSIPLRLAMKRVFVYGDDIITDSEFFDCLQHTFEMFHLKLNQDKCCTGEVFKESCGCDAFMGVDVTPIKVKKQLPSTRHDGQALVSWVSYANSFFSRGYEKTAFWLRRRVEGLLGPLPQTEGSNNLAFTFPADRPRKFKKRWNIKFQYREIRAPKAIALKEEHSSYQSDWCLPFESILCGSKRTGQDPIHTVPDKIYVRQAWILDEAYNGRLRMVQAI